LQSIERLTSYLQVEQVTLGTQKHHHLSEHWAVLRSAAEVTRGEETFMLCEDQSTYMPIGEIHRLKNPSVVQL
jgi:mannose-1-phosphate guanylyltransferase/mannose-6-phosphate isomerase